LTINWAPSTMMETADKNDDNDNGQKRLWMTMTDEDNGG
jgi:hypothetical protein